MSTFIGHLQADHLSESKHMTVVDALRRHPSLGLYYATLCVELVMPLLIWRTPVPDAARWLVDLLVVVLVISTFTKMLYTDRIPAVMVLVLGVTLIGVIVATFEGQSPLATAWGWWLLFKYPMVGIFVYMHPEWPRSMARWTLKACFVLVALQAIVQLLQVATGQGFGDNTAGSFGRHGVTPLVMFIFLSLAFAFGKWLMDSDWRPMVWVLAFGSLSSALGGMRIFPVGAVLLGAVALLIHLLRGGNIGRAFLLVCAFAIGFGLFIGVYDAFSRSSSTYWTQISNTEQLSQYFSNAHYREGEGTYRLGRSYAVQYGWEQLQRDDITLVFGYGLGSRSNSRSLGIVGAAMAESDYGVTQGTDALTFMQEWGIGGLLILAGVFAWLVGAYARAVRRSRFLWERTAAAGLIVFTMGWPFWMWYQSPWAYTFSMLLYWGMTGFVLQRPDLTRGEAFRTSHT